MQTHTARTRADTIVARQRQEQDNSPTAANSQLRCYVYRLHFFAKLLNITHLLEHPAMSRDIDGRVCNVLWYPGRVCRPWGVKTVAPPSTNSPRLDILSIDCRNCDIRSQETIFDVNATAVCLFYHIKTVKFKHHADRHINNQVVGSLRDSVPITLNENMSITEYGELWLSPPQDYTLLLSHT